MSALSAEAAEWKRVSPLTVAAKMIPGLLQSLIPIGIALYTVGNDPELPSRLLFLAFPIMALVVGFVALGAWLNWVRLRYRIGASDVRVEKGLISRSARAVPYERIQDVSLEQKLVPRLLGLVEVKFETGAGGKDDLTLAFIREEEGERLRETVRARVDGEAEVAATLDDGGAREPAEEGHTLFTMGPRRLLTFGLFEFSLVVFGVLGAASQQLEFVLGFEIWDINGWKARLAGPGAWLAGLGWVVQAIGAVVAVLSLVLLGMVTGIIRTVLRDYEFRLQRTPKGFRRRRGLLTKTDVVMPVHRVQAITVRTGLLRRLWGWHGLSFISLAQDAGSSNHDVAPFAQMDEIAPIVDEAGFALPARAIAWQRPSGDHYFDGTALLAIVPLIIAVTALALRGAEGLWIAVPAALFVIAMGLRAAWLWRHDRYALDALQVFSRRGALVPRLKVASRVKLHSVEIAQSPLARWRGYANLHFGLAGGKLSFPGLRLEDATRLRAAVLGSIAEVDFARLPR